jgi:hypothetical protein
VTIDEVRSVRARDGVHDILPVGSHGVRYELRELAVAAGLDAVVDAKCPVDLNCSGGPATCVLVSCAPSELDFVRALRSDLPVATVATLRARG